MKKSRKLLSLLLVLAMMASMTAVSAFSASAAEVDYDYTYTVEYYEPIPQEIIQEFDVYKWNKLDTVEATKPIVGPVRMDEEDPDAVDAGGKPGSTYCHTQWHGMYQNGYLDFYHIPGSGFSGITWKIDKVVDFDIQVWTGAAMSRMMVAICPEPGVFPISRDGNPDNDTGIVFFMECEGRVGVAGTIDPNSVRSTKEGMELGIGAQTAADRLFEGSYNFKTEQATVDGDDMFGIDDVRDNSEGKDCQVLNASVKDGVLTIYDYFHDEVKVSVDLSCKYKGGYITFFTESAQQGSWREISIKKNETDSTGGKHNYGDWEVTKKATATEAGEESRECAGCGEVETREIPKLAAAGWVKTNGKWYYVDANGKNVTNKWMKDSKGWVYLGADGAMLTNKWAKDSKGWCFLGADGYAVTNTWKKDSKGWCYLDANGSQVKSKWVKTSGKWYYLDANGYMVTNKWSKDSKGWVYVGADGAMVTNKWVTDSKGWCYVGADGYAVTNTWKKDSKGWIYLNGEGSMTKSKWVNDGGKWYYCDGNGYMVAGKSMKIGGKTYNFNASGVCTNP